MNITITKENTNRGDRKQCFTVNKLKQSAFNMKNSLRRKNKKLF